jgi:hypothetical protein
MSAPCDIVTERLALGEPLGDAEDHVTTCPACSRLIALPRLVAASAHAAEPHAGFVIRSTTGARTKLVQRRRNRILGNGIAAAAAIVLAVWAVQSPMGADKKPTPLQGVMVAPTNPMPVGDDAPLDQPVTDDLIERELGTISNFDRVIAPSRHWQKVEAPLTGYRFVVEGAEQ